MAVRDKKPLILDFYADWCEPCRALDRKVFSDPQVVRFSKKFVNMRLDLTHSKPNQNEILKKYRIKGVPTILFFDGEGIEKRDLRVESFIEKTIFLKKMQQLQNSQFSRIHHSLG